MPTPCRRTKVRALAVYTLVFLAAAGLVFWPFLSQGRTFIYYYAGQERDGFTQHYTAFVYIGRYLREAVAGLVQGRFELKHFDFALGYGEDVIQCLGYYGFGDPLMLLSALVPARWASGFYQVYVLLELWLAGVSFAVLGRERGYSPDRCLPCALVYVFSGFALWAGLCHPEFLAPMIWFPLLLTGVERALAGRRSVFLPLVAAGYALTGYYWLFMGTIFTCLYALVRFWEVSAGWPLSRRARELGRFFLRAAGGYLLGLMLAAPLFLPNVAGFLQSNRVGGDQAMPALFAGWEQLRSVFLSLIAAGEWNFAGLCAGVLPALLLVLLRREQRGLRVLAVLLAVFCALPVCGWLFNAGAYETTRWYVFLDLFAALFLLAGLDELTASSRRTGAVCAVCVLLYGWAALAAGGREHRWALLLLVLTAALLPTLGRLGRRGACAALTGLVLVNCTVNARLALEGYTALFAPAGLVEGETASMPANAVPDGEAWQRMDQDYANNPNASMLLDKPGVASYFSTSNGNTARFLTEMELPVHNKVLFSDLNSRAILNAVLTTRWWAGTGEGRSVPYGYEPVSEGLWEDVGVLPLGFTYDTVVSEEDWNSLSALERQELMLQAVFADGLEPAGERPASTLTQVELLGVEEHGASWYDGGLNGWEDGGALTLTFNAPADSEVYLRLAGVQLAWSDSAQLALTVSAGGNETRYVFTGEHFLWHSGQDSVLLDLGCHEQGLTGAVLTFERAGGFRLDGLEVWCQPMDEYEDWRDARRAESLTDVQVSTDRVTGSIATTGDRVLAFSIPYSPGWSAYVDGQRVQTLRANGLLLAVELAAGEHTVELRYHSPGFSLGLLLCGAAAGILLLYRRKDRKAE